MVHLKKIYNFDWRVEWVRQMRNKPELMKNFRQNLPISYMEQRRWFAQLNPKNVCLFTVHLDGPDPIIVGYVGLNPIDNRHSHAEFGIFLDPGYHGKGYGALALKLLLKHGFDELKLHKIYSDVLDYPGENTFEFYKKLGFKSEGRLKEHYSKDGKWIDSIPFAMTRKEYDSQKGILESLQLKLAGSQK